MTKSINEVYDVFSWGHMIKYGTKEVASAHSFRGAFRKKADAIECAKKYKYALVNRHRRMDEVTPVFQWKRPQP
jgi:hypothetical protein